MTANQTYQFALKAMINAHFGTTKTPFETDQELINELLPHQKHAYTRVKDQSFIGGLTVVIGEPGTGKTIFKQALVQLPNKQWHIIVINRAIFSWNSFLSLLAQALQIESKGNSTVLETLIISEVRTLHRRGKCLILIVDDAHLIPPDHLKQIRLLLEDFPKNHNLVLIGQPELMTTIKRRDNEDIRSRITQSSEFKSLSPNDMLDYMHRQLDQSGLPHNTFTEAAINLILKVNNGNLRATKNLCLGGMQEALRSQTRTVDHHEINRVLDQPHWQQSNMLEGKEPVVFTNQRPDYKGKDLS